MRSNAAVKARGRIVSWEGASLWLFEVKPGDGEYPRTASHSHHAVQITLALRGVFELSGGETHLRDARRAVVAADARHTFHQKHGLVAHLFVAPESRAGRAISVSLVPDGGLRALPPSVLGSLPAELAAAFDAKATDSKVTTLGRALVERLSGADDAAVPDERVARVIRWAAERLDDTVTLDEAAGRVALSAGRLRHLFVAQTGLPFRVFVLWLRLTRAIERFAGGASLTDAAHEAGFADSAHFSRTCRRMYGISAASLRITPE